MASLCGAWPSAWIAKHDRVSNSVRMCLCHLLNLVILVMYKDGNVAVQALKRALPKELGSQLNLIKVLPYKFGGSSQTRLDDLCGVDESDPDIAFPFIAEAGAGCEEHAGLLE